MGENELPSQPKNGGTKKYLILVIIAMAIIIIIISGFTLFSSQFQNILPITQVSPPAPTPTPTPVSTPSPTSTPAPTPPPRSDELVNYALSLINLDRQQNGLQNVTLSSIDSGQLHANDMLKNGYFSHWDMNGYKPYMRYTLANGEGSVSENIAWEAQTGTSANIDVESALKSLQWGMMYNDSAENWGHRDNIINPLHNEVSIGIAYDNNNLYFVEDFINDYVLWSQLSVNGNEVTMQGTITIQTSNISQIEVFYDNPSPLTAKQLQQDPYNDGYGSGTYVGSVLPPNWKAAEGTTISADNWNQNGNSFQISFSLTQAFAAYGKGVYTLYAYTGSNATDYLTTYSVWIQSI